MTAAPRTFARRHRIAALRLFALLTIPLVFLVQSAWAAHGWIFEMLEILGLALVIGAVLGRFWAILYIGGRKQALVLRDGPYSICRHPLYLFSTLGAFGFGLMLGSFALSVLFGGVVLAVLWATALQEEAHLRAAFGPDYDRYAARVPAILPRLSLWSTPQRIEVDIAHLRGNLLDALVFLALIPIAEIADEVREAGLLPAVLILY